MNKTESKKYIKDNGLYQAIYKLSEQRWNENLDLREIVYRVLDEIPTDILNKAFKKGTR